MASMLFKSSRLPAQVALREVGLRDGLQGVKAHLQTAVKCDWVLLAHAAGVTEIEVGAFVAPDRAPSMADTADVVAFAKTEPGMSVSVLVHDVDGAQEAMAAGVDLIALPIAASSAHSRASIGKSPDEMLDVLRRMRAMRDAAVTETGRATRIEAAISTAFGCAQEGAVPASRVLSLLQAALDAGADTVGLADTFGRATPDAVRALFAGAIQVAGAERLRGHFHHTRGAGLANVLAALEMGIARFDASLAGIGGCAFLPDASGNVSMEALVTELAQRGITTGVEMKTLLELRRFVGAQFGPDVLRAALHERGGHA